MNSFAEVARGVYVLRYPKLDVNATLVVGGHTALVVDTLSTAAQAGELVGEIRRITTLPLTIINTHAHFDHWFGNGTVAGDTTPIWAHQAAIGAIATDGDTLMTRLRQEYGDRDPDFAEALASTPLRPPARATGRHGTLDLGDRIVEVHHFGRGHTDGDLVLHVPDADTILAGDLVEQGAPPGFGDSYPLDWSGTLTEVRDLALRTTVVVPGHGAVVDRVFLRMQHDELTALDWLIRAGHGDGAPAEAVAAKSPFGAAASLVAVVRGYAQLDGGLD